MCKFECSIGLKLACRERTSTSMKAGVSFVFPVTMEGLPVANWTDYVGFSCNSCQPFGPIPSLHLSSVFLKPDSPVFRIFPDLIPNVCQRGTFLTPSKIAFPVFSSGVSASCSLIPTSGPSWYEAFSSWCYCCCLLVLLLFSKLHLWRTKLFNSNMNPVVCRSTRGGEGDKEASVVQVWTSSCLTLAVFQTSYRFSPSLLSASLSTLSSSSPTSPSLASFTALILHFISHFLLSSLCYRSGLVFSSVCVMCTHSQIFF